MRAQLSTLRSELRRASLSGRFHRARPEEGGDVGFTVVETVITLFIVSIVMGLVLGFITNFLQQSTNVRDTMSGVQQDQTAGEGLLQYLHAAIVILPGSNATTIDASILEGVTSGTPQTATFQAELIPPAGPKLDATFQTSLVPNGGYCPIPPAAPNPNCVSINDYDVVNSATVFTYYIGGASITTTTAPTNVQLSQIVAVGIDVTFMAGPQTPTQGFQAVRPTTFETTIYLQNASGAPAPTSAVVVNAPNGTVGSSLTMTATVSPVPDGGFVTFIVTLLGNTLSVCTSGAVVSTTDGTATCSFIPATGGTYDVSATFSGTSDFQPSTSLVTTFSVPQPTSTLINPVTPGSGSLTIKAIVTPSAASGSVTFTLADQNIHCHFHCSANSPSVPVSSGSATWTASNLNSGDTYTINATFQSSSPSTYSNSVAPQTTGVPN